MLDRSSAPRAPWLGSLCLAAIVALSGCGGIDGVELNGGIFDALGVSSGSATTREPKVAERAGLVLPPDPNRLPQPGSEAQTTASITSAQQWPVDPEEKKRQNATLLQKQHDEFCQRELARKKAMGDITTTTGPLGSCDPSVLRALGYGGGQVSDSYRTPEAKATGLATPGR